MRIAMIAALLLAGCAGESIGDLVSNTIESAGRSACRSADNCEDRCANGAVVENSRAICVPGR
jgi:hypothetical protein